MRLRAGIIGCGGISAMHATNYGKCVDTTLVAASDLSQAALDKFAADRSGVTTYLSYEEMLQREKLDVVSVCTPPIAHVTPALAVARAGVKGMLLEKPMALDLSGADAVLSACTENGVHLAVGHQLRYSALHTTARRLLDEGVVGLVERIWGICHNAPLQTNATHTVDLLRYLASDQPVEWVLGAVDATARRYEGILQENAGLGLFQFAGGPVALIEAGSITPSRGYHHIHVEGSLGQMEMGRSGGPDLRIRSAATGGEWQEPPLDAEQNPVDDLANAVRTGTVIRSSGEQGRRTLELILALFESARRNRRVTLPLGNGENALDAIIAAEGRWAVAAAAELKG